MVLGDHQLEVALLRVVAEAVVGHVFHVVGAFQVRAGADVDVFPAVRPELFPVAAAAPVLEDLDAGAVAVGDALAVAVVFLEAVGVVVERRRAGILLAQHHPHLGDVVGHRIADQVHQIEGDAGLGDRRAGQLENAVGGGHHADLAGQVAPLQADVAVITAVQAEQIAFPGQQQAVVDPFVHGVLQGFLDVTEIKHHALGVQVAGQLQVHDPGLPDHAALGVQVGKVHNGQIFNEKRGHRAPSVGG